jgi:hypothetical protein
MAIITTCPISENGAEFVMIEAEERVLSATDADLIRAILASE